jgi:acyl-CoA thioester hydrolase
MDSLGHVNNVVFVDYLQEARVDMMRVHAPGPEAEDLAEGVVVVSHELEYVSPLVYSPIPVRIESWVEEVRAASFRLGYELVSPDPTRRVYVRASSVLSPFVFAAERPRRITAEEKEALLRTSDEPVLARGPRIDVRGLLDHPATHTYDCRVRWSDIDSYNHVNNVKYVEFFQEARIAFVNALGAGIAEGDQAGGFVVARIDVNYHRPIDFRLEPVQVCSWVVRVGRSSYELWAAVRDGDQVFSTSRAVLVGFDPRAGASRVLSEGERRALEPALIAL